jgi:hypothetical protein
VLGTPILRARSWLALGVMLAVTASLGAAWGQQPNDQKVFIVVFDGARYTETFGDPDHRYIPLIWNRLRPKGSISTSFYNRGKTVTTGACNTMLTGNDSWLTFGPAAPVDDGTGLPRSFTPTLFEYYRAATGAPATSVWTIANHVPYLEGTSYSLHPDYGAPYGATWYLGPASDYRLWQRVSAIMDQEHPDLVFVDLHLIDKVAHEGDWEAYTNQILIGDRIVNELWHKIQRNPYYQGRTTLFVTADHGRHTDDWTSHGDSCEGCQHVMFLALGPNIRRGYVVRERDLERGHPDIAATAGALLGIPLPYVIDGHVMEELFVSPLESTMPPAPPAETLVLNVMTTDASGRPCDTFAPGDMVGFSLQVWNAGLVSATVYQTTVSVERNHWGRSYQAAPVVLLPGEEFTETASLQLPEDMLQSGQTLVTATARGLAETGALALGSAAVGVTLTSSSLPPARTPPSERSAQTRVR